jgi:hypothetical protein
MKLKIKIMKTKLKILGGLVFLLSLGACEKDHIESFDSDLSNSADLKAVKNFNNGMIKTYSNETVLKWNELLSQTIDNSMPLPAEAKVYAMVTLAIHDALNNVVPKYETYALDNLSADAGDISHKNIKTIADAAVSQAAREMFLHLLPNAAPAADELLKDILASLPDSELKTRGLEIGKDAAYAMLQSRANDYPMRFEAYIGGTAPGEYQANYMPFLLANPPIWPANAVYAPRLGEMTPFGILSGDQFRNEMPHPLTSEEYSDDYNEVKTLGCTSCPSRNAEQTEIGAFWIESNSSSMNRLARQLIVLKKLDGWEAARLIGLVQMAVIDAYIASFEGKDHFQFWRPVSAIRAGDLDGNDETTGDLTWTSSFFTPPTAEFPSTHAYAGGAAAAVFREYFRNDNIRLSLTSPYFLPGVERSVSSFSQVSYETAISRIYIGYHFRHAVEVGERQGTSLGEFVFQNNLRELKKLL